jgi:hypothetical protein
MIIDLCLEIPHHHAPGCTLVIYTPNPSGRIPGRRAAWICRDSQSSFQAILWLISVSSEPGYRVSVHMTDRYDLRVQGPPVKYPVGLWMTAVFRRIGEVPPGLRDLMEVTNLCEDPYLLPLVL